MGSLATRVQQQLIDLRKLHDIQQQQSDLLRSTYIQKNQHIVRTKLQSNSQCSPSQFKHLLDTIASYTNKIRSVEWDAKRMFPIPSPPPTVFSQFSKEFTQTLFSNLDFRALMQKKRSAEFNIAPVYEQMLARLKLTYGTNVKMSILEHKHCNETMVRRIVDIWVDKVVEVIDGATIDVEFSTNLFDQTEESGISHGRYDYLIQKHGMPCCIIETKNGFVENMENGQSQLLVSMIDLQLRFPDHPPIVGVLTTGYRVRILHLRDCHIYTSQTFVLKALHDLEQMMALLVGIIR